MNSRHLKLPNAMQRPIAIDLFGDSIRRHADIGERDIDVLCGGAPCQGFSLMGRRAMDDPRNQLVFHFVRLVRELRPKYFVFENVKGLTVGTHKKFLGEIVEEMTSAGYEVLLPWQVLNAARENDAALLTG